MLFAVWALLNTWLWSATNQFNRYWQLPGERLLRWRLFLPAVILLPLTFFFTPPSDPVFWLATLISASMVSINDTTFLNVSAKYGAQVAFRVRALILPCVFVGWFILRPQQFTALLLHPLEAAGIVLCLLAVTFFLMRLNKCTVTRSAFMEMLPVLLLGIVFEVTNKTAMDHAAYPNNSLYYIFTLATVPLLISFLKAGSKAPALIADMSGIAKQGMWIGIFMTLSQACKNLAMMATPNPAYVTAITLTAPFWISLYMKAHGEKEQADWVSGSGLVIAVIIMTLLAAAIPH